MKINWGTGIVIAFVLFISFILYFVLTITFQSEYAYDLVHEEYYKEELKHQQVIDKQENTQLLSSKILITKNEQGFEIEFPKEINEETVGTVNFYRPSAKVLDFSLPISIRNNKMSVSHANLISGSWNISIDFTSNSEEYLFKKSVNY